MLTKEDKKTLIKNVWESKKYGVKRLIKEFPNKKWSKRDVEDCQERLRTTGSIERAPGSGRPRTTRTAENIDGVGDLVQSQQNQPLTHRSTRKISRELGIPQTNNWRWLFLFSFAMNVNEQRIIAFLTEKCCYLNLRSAVRTQLRWCGKFTTVACRISSRIKWYKNYKNRLRLAKVIVKNRLPRFYGSLCIYGARTRPLDIRVRPCTRPCSWPCKGPCRRPWTCTRPLHDHVRST